MGHSLSDVIPPYGVVTPGCRGWQSHITIWRLEPVPIGTIFTPPSIQRASRILETGCHPTHTRCNNLNLSPSLNGCTKANRNNASNTRGKSVIRSIVFCDRVLEQIPD